MMEYQTDGKRRRAACADTLHAHDESTDLLLMPHLPQALFALMRRHLMALSLFATWHGVLLLDE